jgi:membrane protein DedA with SNARE-associated domain
MIDSILAAVPAWGLWIVALATFLSCLALPIPASLVMLTAGAFAAAGDLSLGGVAAGAWAGAVLGDQVGYAMARGGARAHARRGRAEGRAAKLMAKAAALAERWGGYGVFLSRWLLSPLGPYMNFTAGAAGMPWARFSAWGAAGEAVWVGIYTGLGYLFAEQIEQVAEVAGNFSGALAAGAVAIGLLLALRAALHEEDAREAEAQDALAVDTPGGPGKPEA